MKRKLLTKIVGSYVHKGKVYALIVMAIGTWSFSSCTSDPFDGETFTSSVRNAQLKSPTADDITISASPDGAQTNISWPVVHGAGGYICSVYDVSDPTAPVAVDGYENKVIDGCSIVVSRTEDVNYQFSIKTAGNENLNNKEAETETKVSFNSFTPTYETIPDGSDLYQYFQTNALPESSVTTNVCYDLEPGGRYTLSDVVDFTNHKVTIRTSSQSNHAKITYTGTGACLQTGTAFALKYVDIDCSGSSAAFFQLSSTPNESIKGIVSGTQSYYDIVDPIDFNGCNIDNVNGMLMYDNGIKYGVANMIVRNCVIHLTTNTESTITVFNFYGGGINSFSMKNTTVYNSGAQDHNYFLRYGNNARSTRMGYTQNLISYENCTFYNIAYKGQWGNYSGFNGQNCSYWVMNNCIFMNCGNSQVARRFIGGSINSSHPTFLNNTYFYDGTFEECSAYDQSGTQIEEDPMLKDPVNGDFTVGGATQVSKGTGDPRWLP